MHIQDIQGYPMLLNPGYPELCRRPLALPYCLLVLSMRIHCGLNSGLNTGMVLFDHGHEL